MTFTLSLPILFFVLLLAFLMGLLTPLFIMLYFVWNAKVK